jgi:hypothetical protein
MIPKTMLLARKAMMVKIRIAAADLTTCQRNASKWSKKDIPPDSSSSLY